MIGATLRTDQALFSDPAWQLKTVQQFVNGEAPRPNGWIHPRDEDLSLDREEYLIWWAPGTVWAVTPLMWAGMSPARATRTVAAVCVLAGSVGWTLWFAEFGLPAALVAAYAAALPWLHLSSNALFMFSSEILVFAATPWVLLAALAAARAPTRTSRWLATGTGAGLLYVIKYSATFVTGGVVAWLAWQAWRAFRVSRDRAVPVCAVAAAVSAAAPIVALSLLNRHAGGAMNLMAASGRGQWHWVNLLHIVAFPALIAADLDAVLRYVLLHPTHGLTRNPLWLSVIGSLGGVVLLPLVVRRGVTVPAADLARAVLASSMAGLLLSWTISDGVGVEARFLFTGGSAALPLALAEGRALWRDRRPALRAVLAATAFAFVVVPFAYGFVSVAAKVWRYPAYHPGASGQYNPLLAQTEAASVTARLQRDFVVAEDVWYLPEPQSALDLAGRAIIRHADFQRIEDLRLDRFVTSRTLRAHVLLPPRFERNGKGAVIRASFPQATEWTREAIPGSEYDRWTATLAVPRAAPLAPR